MSEGEAQRRIDGARLLRSFPEFVKNYEIGELNFTHATLLRRHFRIEARIHKENLSRINQFELVQKLLGKSTREAERILVEVSSWPELQKPTSQYEKLLKNGNYRVQFEARPELRAKAERLREIWFQTIPGATWPELIVRAFELAIEKCDPHAKAGRNHLRQHQRFELARHCGEQGNKQSLKASQRSQSEKQKVGAKSKNHENQNAGVVCKRKTVQGIGCESDCDRNVAQNLDHSFGRNFVLTAAQNLDHTLDQNFVLTAAQNQNSISEPDVISNSGAGNNFDVDPITGEIQLRLPLDPVNVGQTRFPILSDAAQLMCTAAPIDEAPLGRTSPAYGYQSGVQSPLART
jgi:hypothetical protein